MDENQYYKKNSKQDSSMFLATNNLRQYTEYDILHYKSIDLYTKWRWNHTQDDNQITWLQGKQHQHRAEQFQKVCPKY